MARNIKTEVKALLKLGVQYNLKSLEVTQTSVKIEFNEAKEVKSDDKPPQLTPEQQEFIKKKQIEAELDEMQLLDPVKYEELLSKEP